MSVTVEVWIQMRWRRPCLLCAIEDRLSAAFYNVIIIVDDRRSTRPTSSARITARNAARVSGKRNKEGR
jgi:hypothetical protein